MNIDFKNRQLEKCYKSRKQAVKKYGKPVGERYMNCINIIEQANSIEELEGLPMLRCHLLKGNYAGRYAVNITGFYRLIFSLKGDSQETVLIEEVSKHYGD